ncbi:MAG: M28 family peptidase [Kiritimatiellae bacterium]|nr:M28 family peptidase [Kiritimatiellia bacterium]
MERGLAVFLCAVAAFVFAACGARPAANAATEDWRDRATHELGEAAFGHAAAFVALGPKRVGTDEIRRAAEWIRSVLLDNGIRAEIDGFSDATPAGEMAFSNVAATIPAAGRPRGKKPPIVILGAHYDTKSGIENFVGANDSASGVGALLALAPVLAEAGLPFETRLLFFDGEESLRYYAANDGLHGSRHAAAALSAEEAGRVVAMILLDMVGDRDLRVDLERKTDKGLARRILRAAEKEGVREHFAVARGDFGLIDDHVPFRARGIPCADLCDFEYGEGRNAFWHTAEDTLDKISAASLGAVLKAVERVLYDLAKETP